MCCYGSLWEIIGRYGSLLVLMGLLYKDSYGSLCVLMGLYGFLWVLMCAYGS